MKKTVLLKLLALILCLCAMLCTFTACGIVESTGGNNVEIEKPEEQEKEDPTPEEEEKEDPTPDEEEEEKEDPSPEEEEEKEPSHTHVFDKQVAENKYLKSAASCTAKALYYLSCECGEKGEETFEHGSLLAHDYSSVKYDEEKHWNECTCGAKQDEENHSAQTIQCECGYKNNKASIGLKYELSETEDYYIVVGRGECEDREIVIPETHENLPVLSIGERAFYGCSSLEKVIFEENSQLKSIGDTAFGFCGSLSSIIIPSSVTSMGSRVFYVCGTMTIYCEIGCNTTGWSKDWNQAEIDEIDLHRVVWGYEYIPIDGIMYGVMDNTCVVLGVETKNDSIKLKSNLTYKDINYNITKIENSAFFSCSSIVSIEISSSITSIGNSAFYNCSSLETVTFKGTVEEWQAVDYGYWYSGPATKVVCSDGEVAINQ